MSNTYESISAEDFDALAREMGVITRRGMRKLTDAGRAAVAHVLRDLDDEERYSIVLMSSNGRWDWHMVDGTTRVWHFTEDGEVSWNMLPDRVENSVLHNAYDLGFKEGPHL